MSLSRRMLRNPILAQKVPKLPLGVSLATWDASEGCGGYPDTPPAAPSVSQRQKRASQ